MDEKKKRASEKMGGRVTTLQEFLGLSDIEVAIMDMRIDLARALRKRRAAAGVTQTELAKAIGSSQSRVAKMEAGDPDVSLELLMRAILAVGGKPKLKVA